MPTMVISPAYTPHGNGAKGVIVEHLDFFAIKHTIHQVGKYNLWSDVWGGKVQ
jgi:hypothetical protein